ncbi:MAG: tellurite resistance TerB C-terminal domain-containing protein [Rhizonema sp. PD37]|nr:tellurite resistance TerB C-terminal domain-containing protein [Rhizonema sp. PD37]
MQSTTAINNRFMIGIVAFGVSFVLSFFLSWNFNQALITGITTVPATYLAAFFVDKRRKNYEMLILDSLRNRIREIEVFKSRILVDINKLEGHKFLLHQESNNLQSQLVERRNQRDSLNRELNYFVIEKKQLKTEITNLHIELIELEKTKVELHKSFSNLTSEKRRLDLNYNVSRSEISKLQNQISELQQQKQELESSLTLLNRLKPQLEEKLHQMRVEVQKLENQEEQQNQLLLDKLAERENIETYLNCLKIQIVDKETEFGQLQEQFALLQNERDQLQSQVWELLHQMETLTQETLHNNFPEDDVEVFPFLDLIESLELSPSAVKPEMLPEEWNNFFESLPSYEIQVLKAILEQDRPNATIKKIAEEHISMPNLLIDSINERANDIIGELLVDPSSDSPTIYQEHVNILKKLIARSENIMAKQVSAK